MCFSGWPLPPIGSRVTSIWLLMVILMLVTGVASAALDNVTTMLLMTPITVQIALALGLNPLTPLIPEVLASYVAGISTLIGTPTNIAPRRDRSGLCCPRGQHP